MLCTFSSKNKLPRFFLFILTTLLHPHFAQTGKPTRTSEGKAKVL